MINNDWWDRECRKSEREESKTWIANTFQQPTTKDINGCTLCVSKVWLECIRLACSVVFPSLPMHELGLGACLTSHILIYTFITSLPALNNSSISPSQNPNHHFRPAKHFLKRLQLATTWNSCHLTHKPHLISSPVYKRHARTYIGPKAIAPQSKHE